MRTGRLPCRLGLVAAVGAAFVLAAPVASAQTAEEPQEPTATEEQTVDEPTPVEEPPAAAQTQQQKRLLALKKKRVMKKIRRFRQETWRWQRLMRVPLTPSRRLAERSRSLAYKRWVLRYWKAEAAKARRKAKNPPRLGAWLCIKRYEGAWNANTGNGYYGGLQMDLTFQRMYGLDLLRKKGTANRWKPIEQIWVAERAYRSGRGFYPWPNTARKCGLI